MNPAAGDIAHGALSSAISGCEFDDWENEGQKRDKSDKIRRFVTAQTPPFEGEKFWASRPEMILGFETADIAAFG